MILFENLSKGFWVRGEWHTVLDNLTLTLPRGKSLALLGRNGAGKSTLLKIIAGTMPPTAGRVVVHGSVSWPVGFGGSFHRDLTGAQNTKFLARVYGVDTQTLVDFVEDFAELGKHFHMPMSTYSSGMYSRLAFGVSMGIAFDVYLVDEVTAVGDARFRAKSAAVFAERMKHASSVLVSHNPGDIQKFCDAALLLHAGKLTYFDDVDQALAAHGALLR
ncbi:ABC transporter ATP-binding protein [Pseudorhodobacter sp. MZDSW-24AT]|uniref:ABC transporter ATP-binding protein n=1 Tax=Pseudorhodobacter sp. MZDSW-24AT TaxID=2052957 RepID=UPI000C1ED8AF|nr:ABC transporter ATP-binding protein [Pseudorhodobacter sp. MZDSW-24AT]PJF11318.1 ABC transporter ATP-binding protein [Pseudorhodobacter sp. MZDSW-24AT]